MVLPLPDVLKRLRRAYGSPPDPEITDPFEAVLWVNVAYLVDDARRAAAFEALRERVGLTPAAILGADDDALVEVAALGGMRPGDRVDKLRTCATIALDEHDGDLATVVRSEPIAKATRALRRYPGIGAPGAELILLLAGRFDGLPLESNGLRALVRLGFGAEGKSYAATYRAVRDAITGQLPRTAKARRRAHALLRRHGQQTCKVKPHCERCPLDDTCPSAPS